MDLFKIFSRSSSKNVAKERLRLILIHDRCYMSEEVLKSIKAVSYTHLTLPTIA